MRTFMINFFRSHGSPIGYLGSLSQKGLPEIFSKWVVNNLSKPLRHPTPLVDPLLTKNLDTAGPWCEKIATLIWEEKIILSTEYSDINLSKIFFHTF